MGYLITTIEEHRRSIDADHKRQVERLSHDVEDVALSTWATSNHMRFESLAIRALELGAENGIDGPAVEVPVLRYASTGAVVNARFLPTKFGAAYHIDGGMDVAEIGREWVSCAPRTLKKLGLVEDFVVLPASRYADADCPFVGAPVSFRLKPRKDVLERFLQTGVIPTCNP